MTAEQLSGWEAYFSIEPFGDNLLDLRLAGMQSMLANYHRDRENNPTPYTIEDFAAYLEPSKKYVELTPEENGELIKAQLMALSGKR